MPCAMAPAWPLVPPPCTWTLTSNFRCVLVTRSGANAASSSTRRPRNASASFSLTVTRPSPGWMRTRATAFFRRPIPRLNVSANLDFSLRVECQRPRLLSRMAMVGARVHPQPREHVRAQRVVLEHAPNRVRDRERRVDRLRGVERAPAQPAGIAGVARVLLGRALDRKSTRLNSSHVAISYAVFCLKKKKKKTSTAFKILVDGSNGIIGVHFHGCFKAKIKTDCMKHD